MQRRKLKQLVLQILAGPSLPDMFHQLGQYPPQSLTGPLFSALCSSDELIRWHAISAFGDLAQRLAECDMEQVRILMRRMLWSLNDESGGIGWGAPEAMAEIMYNLQLIREEYLHMLLSYVQDDGPELFQDGNFIELPYLQRGVLWGISRIAEKYSGDILNKIDPSHLGFYLKSSDTHVLALAIRCLRLLGVSGFSETVKQWVGRTETVRLYLSPNILEIGLSTLAKEYIITSGATNSL
jgi:hypothetical protein